MTCALAIRNLILHIKLGVFPEEKLTKKDVQVNIEFRFITPPKGCDTDDIKDTICYADLIKYIRKNIENKSFNLIEALSKEIYEQIKIYINSSDIKLSVEVIKNNLPIQDVNEASFRYGDF